MKNYLFSIVPVLWLVFGLSQPHYMAPAKAPADQVVGTWLNQEGEAQVEIYQQSGRFYGKIVWLKEPNGPDGKPKLDEHNPKPELRSQAILGSLMLRDLRYDAEDNAWTGGQIYDGRKGDTYKCIMRLEAPNKLAIRGYVGAAWMGLGKTTVWTRVE